MKKQYFAFAIFDCLSTTRYDSKTYLHHRLFRTRRPFIMLFIIFWGCQPSNDTTTEAIPHETSILLPIAIDSYQDGSGMFFRASISLDGGAPFDVLLDTGSEGLRIFASDLPQECLPLATNEISPSHTVQFGYAELMKGPLVQTNVHIGQPEELIEPIVIHWVDELSCLSSEPNCSFADGTAPFFTDMGLYGILGTSLRSGTQPALYNPFAQLPEPYSNEYLIHWNQTSSTGFVQLGNSLPEDTSHEYTSISLSSHGSHPNGSLAWKDDALRGCFFANDIPIYEPCTELVLDSGSSADVVYSPTLNQDWIDWDILAPSVQFSAEIEDVFSYFYRISHNPQPSIDLVFVDTFEPFALLGIRFFTENDVGYNLQTGVLVLQAHN